MFTSADPGLPPDSHEGCGINFDPLSDEVAFPQLTDIELSEVVPFGDRCSFVENKPLVSAGDCPFSSYVILSGQIRIIDISTGAKRVPRRASVLT
jgi:hypothetical protein